VTCRGDEDSDAENAILARSRERALLLSGRLRAAFSVETKSMETDSYRSFKSGSLGRTLDCEGAANSNALAGESTKAAPRRRQ
jgi:hypothetical protein